MVTQYLVEWQRDTLVGCTDEDQANTTITDGSVSYAIVGLESDSRYTITVTANINGSEVSNTVTAMTKETGKGVTVIAGGTIILTVSAPSAPPSSVRVSVESSTAISVQWGPVEPCADQNGPITGYSVRYGVVGSGSQLRPLLGDSSGGMTTISDLTPSTTYSIQVAAENNDLIGLYSTAVDQLTEGMYFIL